MGLLTGSKVVMNYRAVKAEKRQREGSAQSVAHD